MRPVPLSVSIILVPIFIACGADAPPADDTAPAATEAATEVEHDPCELITTADAEAAIGAPAESERPPEANNDWMATCRYVAPRGQGVAVLVVTVGLQSAGAAFDNARRMEEAGVPTEPVSGVGDEALWAPDLTTLHVRSDSVFFTVGGDITPEQSRELAATVIGRLR